MKKRLFGIFLTLVLACILCTAALAHDCTGEHSSTWRDFNAYITKKTEFDGVLGTYRYYLSDDFDLGNLGISVLEGSEVTICLNGHTLSGAEEIMNVAGTLNLYGCGESVLDGSVYIADTGTFNMYYGTVGTVTVNAGTFALDGGTVVGGVTVDGGTLNMSGGTITDSDIAVDMSDGTFTLSEGLITGNDVALKMAGGKFSMTGGTIANNLAEAGGVYIADGSGNISAGTITDGLYIGGGSTIFSGGTILGATIGVDVAGGMFTAVGGEITGNIYGVDVRDEGMFYVYGSPNIYGNTYSNVKLADDKFIGVTGTLYGAQIYVSMADITDSIALAGSRYSLTESDLHSFYAENSGYCADLIDGDIVLVASAAVAESSYYLSADTTEDIIVPDGASLNIYLGEYMLNGDITISDDSALMIYGTGSVNGDIIMNPSAEASATASYYLAMADTATINGTIYVGETGDTVYLSLDGVTANSGESIDADSIALLSKGTLNLGLVGSCSLTAGETAKFSSYGIYAEKLNITGSGTLIATGSDADGDSASVSSVGIYSGDAMTIKGAVTLDTYGGEATSDVEGMSAGIVAETIIISGGTTYASGAEATGSVYGASYGFKSEDFFYMTDGTLIATAARGTGTISSASYGIYAFYTFSVDGGMIIATAGDTPTGKNAYSIGIGSAFSSITINAGTVEATSGKSRVIGEAIYCVDEDNYEPEFGDKAVVNEYGYEDPYNFSSALGVYYTVLVNIEGSGESSPSGITEVKQYNGKTFKFTPSEGSVIKDVLIDGESIGAVSSYSFIGISKSYTIDVIFTEDFSDVNSDDYYYDAVAWAVDNYITSGTGAGTFSPSSVCTRAQAVAFLWNAAGCPVGTYANPFSDVSSGDWYYNAVLWAVNNNITSGTGDTTFAPNEDCTRAQIVTLIYNSNGKPSASSDLSFDDVSSDAWYSEAVIWAASNALTTGTGEGVFSPNSPCTRAEIVTLLYRNS